VSVRAVITRSPAFQSDVLRGDIITRFADVDIFDPDQFFDTVVANQGKQVSVELFRNGEKKTITAQLLAD
jgi:S1-C subfamily serine protease